MPRSRLTARSQTTVPAAVREALGLHAGDAIDYRIDDGRVTLARAGHDEDPVLGEFLEFLANDLVERRDIRAIPPQLIARARSLVKHVRVNRDERITGPVDL